MNSYDRLLWSVETLNNEEEDCRTAKGGAETQTQRTQGK